MRYTLSSGAVRGNQEIESTKRREGQLGEKSVKKPKIEDRDLERWSFSSLSSFADHPASLSRNMDLSPADKLSMPALSRSLPFESVLTLIVGGYEASSCILEGTAAGLSKLQLLRKQTNEPSSS